METQSFVSVLSHELRNQLTLIASSLQLVGRQCPAVLEISFWPQIEQDVQETIGLLKDASSFAKSSQFHPKPQNAADFLARLCESCSPLMKERSIRFCVNLDESLQSAAISADALKLKEAIMNLLLNACDAVSGSKTPTITLSAFLSPKENPSEDAPPEPPFPPDSLYPPSVQLTSTHIDDFSHLAPNSSTHIDDFSHLAPNSSTRIDNCPQPAPNSSTCIDNCPQPAQNSSTHRSQPAQSSLQIHIHDNGPGIPEEYLSTLFDPFVTHKAHGTGLGLSITENIAKQHGGTITVHTCTTLPDTYTDFCLSLPVLQG